MVRNCRSYPVRAALQLYGSTARSRPRRDMNQSRRVQLGHLWMRENRYSFVFLWRGPPTGLATLCNALSLGSSKGAPCPSRTTCESVRLSACACQQTVCNWWATFVALLCSGISLKWPRPGQERPKRAPTLLYEFNPNFFNASQACRSSSALLYCPEPQSRAASRRHRTAPLR